MLIMEKSYETLAKLDEDGCLEILQIIDEKQSRIYLTEEQWLKLINEFGSAGWR